MYYDSTEEKTNDYTVMGRKMRYCRLSVPVTQRELGNYFKIKAEYISRYELGKAVPSLPFLLDFSRRFGVAMEDLVNNLFSFESFTKKYTPNYLFEKSDGHHYR